MLSDYIVIVKDPKPNETGIRLRQKSFKKDSFTTCLDISHIVLEEYKGSLTYNTKGEEVVATYVFNTEDIDLIIKGLNKFKKKEERRIVSVKLVTDMNEYKKDK